jgi:hypothetical protein
MEESSVLTKEILEVLQVGKPCAYFQMNNAWIHTKKAFIAGAADKITTWQPSYMYMNVLEVFQKLRWEQ